MVPNMMTSGKMRQKKDGNKKLLLPSEIF